MSKGWTIERLQSLQPEKLLTLYSNARAIQSPEAIRIVKLVSENNLLQLGKSASSAELARGQVRAKLKPWTQYQIVVVETYRSNTAGDTDGIHVRPAPGETFASSMNVECSREMRFKYPIGTRFAVRAKVIEKEGGNAFLYTHYDWPYEVISDAK